MPTSVMTKTGTRKQNADCCTEAKCDSGLRNNYFDGKRLSTYSFRLEQKYGLDRRRLLNRAIHGWGVVYGYAIEPEPEDKGGDAEAGTLEIGSGLALDQCGRELLQTGSRAVALKDLILIEDGKEVDLEDLFPSTQKYRYTPAKDTSQDCWVLSAHYTEQYHGTLDVKSSCQCEHREWDQICETVRYSLQRIDCDKCCCNFECELNCECGTEPCEKDTTQAGAESSDAKPRSPSRGGCRCLCEYITNLKLEDDGGPLCTIDEPCGAVRVDLRHGVPLACVKLVWDEICDEWRLGEVEACGPRRLVKRNDLLFDLIRGCDLTRISEIGWAKWHRKGYRTDPPDPVPFSDFRDAFGDLGHREDEYVTRDFWVRFSRPVREDTLLPDCFAFWVMSGERGEGWWETLRVPIRRLDTSVIPSQPNDPAGYVRGARIVVDGAWADDALAGTVTRFQGAGAWVEIAIRGDLILDCNGQAVDANAVGLDPYRSGNGAPGDNFLSSFHVAPAPPESYSRKGAKS